MNLRTAIAWLMKPIRPGHYLNLSRAAGCLAAAAVVFGALAIKMQLALSAAPDPLRANLIDIRGNLTLVAALCVIVGLIIAVRDIVDTRSGGPERRDAEARSFARSREEDRAQRAEHDAGLRRELN